MVARDCTSIGVCKLRCILDFDANDNDNNNNNKNNLQLNAARAGSTHGGRITAPSTH